MNFDIVPLLISIGRPLAGVTGGLRFIQRAAAAREGRRENSQRLPLNINEASELLAAWPCLSATALQGSAMLGTIKPW